ncbi:response regulator [Labilibacter marinus]|uniref:response regulator n=1 Tax=Labilibacter marinus TaxID=1477105 RepID=UPI00095029A3|nr:response regulator [Labilibacter marinus]
MSDKTKILYVDDEHINLQLFQINFSKKFDVILAEDGAEGLRQIEKNPDTNVVISDMKMPNLSGIDFISRAKKKHPNIKYYILTGFEITPEIKEALERGLIIKYFSKPFDFHDISLTLDEATVH